MYVPSSKRDLIRTVSRMYMGALPGDLPPWSKVYGYFRRWRKDRTWLQVHDKLYQWVRVAASREPSP